MATPKLKSKTKKFILISWGDLRDFIQKTYGGNLFNCLETENGANVRACVEPGRKLDQYDQTLWDEALEKKRIEGWRLQLLIQGFADKGLIPYGEYLINVSW